MLFAVEACYEAVDRRFQPYPSIFSGQTLSDFIDPFVKRIEPCVKASVLKVENITQGQKSENPVMTFDTDDRLLDRVTDRSDNALQDDHRIPPF